MGHAQDLDLDVQYGGQEHVDVPACKGSLQQEADVRSMMIVLSASACLRWRLGEELRRPASGRVRVEWN